MKGRKVNNANCLPLYFPNAESSRGLYFIVNTSTEMSTTSWNHAQDPFYNDKFCSDFIFTKVEYDGTPIKFSETPVEGRFSENTYWYYMNINSAQGLNRYITYTELNDGEHEFSLCSKKPKTYGSFWAFVKNNDNTITIYNAATGADKVLTLTNEVAQTDVNIIKMLPKAENEKNAWTMEVSNRGYIMFSNNNYYINHTDANISGKGTKLYAKKNATGEWSDIKFESAQDLGSIISSIKESIIAPAGAVGTLIQNDFQLFETEINKGTMEGIVAALRILDLTGAKVDFDENKYYRIENVMRRFGDNNNYKYNGGYLEVVDFLERTNYNTGHGIYANTKSPNRASAIWKFNKTGDNTYKLYNLNSKCYFKKRDADSYLIATDNAEETDNIVLENTSVTQFLIKKENSQDRLHVSGSGNFTGAVMYYNQGEKDSPSAWFLIPAETIELSISDAGYATVNYPFAVQLPEGVTAYTGTAMRKDGKDVMHLSPIQGNQIPANTPVVLEGEAGTYTLSILTEEIAALDKENDFAGSLLSKEIEPDSYILANEGSGIGFYTVTGGNLPQNRAYLPLEKVPAPIQGTRSLSFSFGDEGDGTTGIEENVVESEKEEYYDLQGRRVMNPTKGIYVTKSGKKVLFLN